MKPPPLTYARPSSLMAALELLAEEEDAVVLAGGQSLVALLNLRLARPSVLVDITRVEELSRITMTTDGLLLGSTARQLEVEAHALVWDRCPLIPAALRFVGHSQIRARGTIGGSLAHADPSAELATACLALDATVMVASTSSQREIRATDFFLAPYTTALAPAEIVTAVRVPSHADTCAFTEFARRDGDFALLNVAVATEFEDGRLRAVGIAIGGSQDSPRRVPEAESILVGTQLSPEDITHSCSAAGATITDGDDPREPAGYRRRLAMSLLRDALTEVADGRSRTR